MLISSSFTEEYLRFVKPTKQMKLCKSPKEQLFQQHEHKLIQLWCSQNTSSPGDAVETAVPASAAGKGSTLKSHVM